MQQQQQQAQLEAMRILQQQHMLPSIVAPKQEELGLMHVQSSGPWSSEDYDSMMRTILDATLPSDHFTDLEAPASLASFSASYAGSYVSGSSDSGASPHSINDLVYGAANFPTPPDPMSVPLLATCPSLWLLTMAPSSAPMVASTCPMLPMRNHITAALTPRHLMLRTLTLTHHPPLRPSVCSLLSSRPARCLPVDHPR